MPPKAGRVRRTSDRKSASKSAPKELSLAAPSDRAFTLENPSTVEAEQTPKDAEFKGPLSKTLTLVNEEGVGNNDNGVVADDNNNNNNNNNGGTGKRKKVVKKTVKVVKKVITKVKKRVPKRSEITNPSSTTSAVQMNAENCDSTGKEEEKAQIDDEKKDGSVLEGGEVGKVEKEKFFSEEFEAMERRKRRRTEIFIGGLDKGAKEEDIRKVFAEAGEIVNLRLVMKGNTGKNKGFAFVRYACAEDAKRALEKFAKVEICAKQCEVAPVEEKDTIFIGNIDRNWKDEDVTKLLQEIEIEKIDKVTVMTHPNKCEHNRGFAVVEFETKKDAQAAFKKLQKKNVLGKNRNIKVTWAEPLKDLDEEEMSKVKTVYAEFLPSSWDEERVRDTFKKFGEIDDIVLSRNLRTTKRNDFAFINYKTRDAAIECLKSFSEEIKDDNGNKVNVKVSFAKSMQKDKKHTPAAKSFAKEVPIKKQKTTHKEVPRKKQKTTHINSQPVELRNMAQPALPRYDIQIDERNRAQSALPRYDIQIAERNRVQPALSRYDIQIADRASTNVELVRLLREQASWRPSNASLSTGAGRMGVHYSLSGEKCQLSMLEADPLRPESRYPYSRLDASFPAASSSRNVMPHAPSGLSSSLVYQQHDSRYRSESLYGARYYPGLTEIRDRTYGSGDPYHRYEEPERPYSTVKRYGGT